MSTRKDRMNIVVREGVTVMDLGEMDIWDGADLSLLRDTLLELIQDQKKEMIGVDMTFVKYIPSGFFGMLYDWHEKGIEFFLYTPQPNVGQMLWFQQFFEMIDEGVYQLQKEPKEDMAAIARAEWEAMGYKMPAPSSPEKVASAEQ